MGSAEVTVICAACTSNNPGRFQTGCPECYIRHTAILPPDERTRRYEQIKADHGHAAAAVEFVGKVNRQRQINRGKRNADAGTD